MFGTRLLLCALTCAEAQVVTERVAGVDRHGGEYAWEMGIHSAGTTWDDQGNAYFGAFNRIWKEHPDGIVEVIGGTGEGGTADVDRYGGEGGPAIRAKFAFPDAAHRDAKGQIYFLANNRILRIGTDGVIKTVAGNGLYLNEGMATEGRVEDVAMNPGKFAISPDGVAYFYDFWLVRRADPAGNVTVVAAAESCDDPCGGPETFTYPAKTPKVYLIKDLDIDPKTGEVYITEQTRPPARSIVIHKLSSGGTLAPFRELPSSDTFFVDLAVDKDGNLFYVRGNGPGIPGAAIHKLGRDKTFPVTVPNGYLRTMLFLNPDGRMVYTDGTTVRFAEDGTVWRSYPDGVMHPSPDRTLALQSKVIGQIGLTSLAINRAGEIYFTETSTCRVRKFDQQKLLQTVFALEACGQYPEVLGIAVGPDGRLWIVGYHRAWVSSPGGGFSDVTLPPEMSGTVIAVDSRSRLYAGSFRLEPDGSARRFCTACGSLGSDAVGNVYYSNSQGVYRVEDDASSTKILAGDYTGPARFVIDSHGHLWWGLDIPGAGLQDVTVAPNGDLYALADPYIFSNPSLLEIYKRTEVAAPAMPLISAAGIVNGASYAGNGVSPGELVSVFGENFGLTALQVSQVANNHLPTKLGPVKVTFNGIEGAITAASPKQINVFVPSSIEPSTDVKIKVFVNDSVSEEITLPVVETMFGLSTLDASGKGQGAILNANGTVNSRANPAQAGSLIVLFGTGEGKVYPDAGIGAVNVAAPYPKAVKALSVRIGGQQAEIVFAGGAPLLAQGVYQINARIPAATPSGDMTVEVIAEGGQTSKPVTVAVQ